MYSIQELEKQQIGLRLPQHLINDIDDFTEHFSVNRTDIVIEALRSYLAEQKAKIFYDNFDKACKEVTAIRNGELEVNTLGEFIGKFESNTNT